MRVLACLAIVAFATSVVAEQVLLQVEDFDGPWRKQTNITGYLGTGFRTSNANPAVADSTMKGTARIEEPGAYAVWVRAYTSENSRRALQAEVAGKRLAVTHRSSERHWMWEKAGELALAAGEVPVVVHDAADGFESADAILLSDDLAYRPDAQEALERQWLVYDGKTPREANALRFNIEACCAALDNLPPAPAAKADWEAKRAGVRDALAEALGLAPMPEKTPLDARVTGKAERDRYTIENVLFESRPHFYVTANLYIPKDVPLPVPAVVVTMGHAMEHGKNYELYQRAQLGLVHQGFAVLGVDPIGQGERRRPGYDHPLGYGSLLVGRSNEGYIVWDTLRALDYLVSRPEVDASRIGLTGNSGGGECTFYTMPFDDRFAAGASFCFVCSYEQWIRHGGNHCICNHFPGIVHKMEEYEIIGLNAPRPFLFGNGAKDKIFPIRGVRDTFERSEALYACYDAADCVRSVEADLGHGWSQPLREAGYGWLCHWLMNKGDGSPIAEGDYDCEDPNAPDILCLDGGPMPEDELTMVDLNRQRADALRVGYATPPDNADIWAQQAMAWRDALWEQLGGRPEDSAPKAQVIREFSWDAIQVEALSLEVEPGMSIAALTLTPPGATESADALLYLHDAGKAEARQDPLVRLLLDAGTTVLAIDPRGLGETQVHENHLTSDSICLGRPIFAQRAWDTLQAARYLKTRTSGPIACYGYGACGLTAVFAAGLGAPIDRLLAERPLASFRFFLENDQPQPIWLSIPGMLETADVAQVAALAAPAALCLADAVGFGLKPLAPEQALEEFAFTQAAYALRQEGERFVLSHDMCVEEKGFFLTP